MSVLFYVLFFLLVGSAAYAGWRGAPWVPTRKKELHQVLTYLQQSPPKNYGIDLGCGTGSLLFLLAERYPDMTLHGYDISLGPLLFGCIRKFFSYKRYKNVHFHVKNLYRVNVSLADLIFIFMMPEPHTRIARTVLSKAQPDATILFEAWPPEGFKEQEVIQREEVLPLFMYHGKTFSRYAL
jgi:SAM-dependent methyltransferase